MARAYYVTPNGRGSYAVKKHSSGIFGTIILFVIAWALGDSLLEQTWGTVVMTFLLALGLVDWIASRFEVRHKDRVPGRAHELRVVPLARVDGAPPALAHPDAT